MQDQPTTAPLMQKLDAWTPWHELRTYPNKAEAMLQAHRYASQRAEGDTFPKYSVFGRIF